MTGRPSFSLGRRLIGGIFIANLLILAVSTPWFLWRGYRQHDIEIESGREAFNDWLFHEVVTDVIPLTLPLLVTNLLFAIWIVRRSLAPINALSRQVAAIDVAHLQERLPTEGVPSEIMPFIRSINAGLDRIADGVDSQKRFTANAAHELRTPLAVLKARCSGGDCDTSPKLAADVDRMAKVVDQMLSIARLEMRQIPLDAPVDLNAMCRQVVADLYPWALGKGVELAFHADEAWSLAQGNDLLLGDALRNLIENAVRLSTSGLMVEVDIAAPGLIRVLDHGPGVPDEVKDEIFLPFRRGKSAKGSGAGLGLSIASEVVGLHGGTLSVADRQGGGAIFSIDLTGRALPSGQRNVAAQ